ncbi:MAG TPA: hypothetical protein VFG09_00605 [Thermodesulfovibrionales bacterium]|nr:hypothetical protein [Thermodesulfovibrionales bacterium]
MTTYFRDVGSQSALLLTGGRGFDILLSCRDKPAGAAKSLDFQARRLRVI